MKINTQKLLLFLYSDLNSSSIRVNSDDLKIVTPQLSDGGRRSLVHLLNKNGLIHVEKTLGKTFVCITRRGVKALESRFPALSRKWDDWQGNWDCIVFIRAPKSDGQFRYLRSLLISEGSISISRGAYICPFSFSQKVIDECNRSYFDSILMFSVGEWKIASIRKLVIEKYSLIDLADSYSGISKDVSRLLVNSNNQKTPMEKNKDKINLVYDRLQDLLKDDPGFCNYYFNEVPKIRSILLDLNSIITRY